MIGARVVCILCFAASLSGCAYLTTYNRAIDLKDGSVAMDVKQRVVFSQRRVLSKPAGAASAAASETSVVVCAEPSPDALTVLGVSGGLSINSGDKVANAAGGLAETGASIGLRTQSIQLLRDAMYRLCEGYAGGAVTDTDFAAMQRRYQSTMMGLIAIEQLTRPVVAGQALLTSSAAAQGGASGGDSAVDKAQQRLDAAKTSDLAAQTELDKAIDRNDTARKNDSDLTDKLDAQIKKKPEDQDATAVASLKEQLAAANKERQDSQLALADARRRKVSAEDDVRSAAVGLRSAQSRASASASGAGVIGSLGESAAKSTEYLTRGVVDIVIEINSSYTKDACLALLTELVRSPETIRELARTASTSAGGASTDVLFRSLNTCEKILAAEQARAEMRPTRAAP